MCIHQAHQWNLQQAAGFSYARETDQLAVTVRILPGAQVQITQKTSIITDKEKFETLIKKLDIRSRINYTQHENYVLAFKQDKQVFLHNPSNLNELELICTLEQNSLNQHIKISDTLELLEKLYLELKEVEVLSEFNHLENLELCLGVETFHELMMIETKIMEKCLPKTNHTQTEKRETSKDTSQAQPRVKRSLIGALLSDQDLTEQISQDLKQLSDTYNKNWKKLNSFDNSLTNSINHIYATISTDEQFANHLESSLISISHDVHKIHKKTSADLRFLTKIHNVQSKILDSLDNIGVLKKALHQTEDCSIAFCNTIENIIQTKDVINIKIRREQKEQSKIADIICEPYNATHISFLAHTTARLVNDMNILLPSSESLIPTKQLKNVTFTNSNLVPIKKENHEGYFSSNLLRVGRNTLICLQQIRLSVNSKSVICKPEERLQITNTTRIQLGHHSINYQRQVQQQKIRPRFQELSEIKEKDLQKWKQQTIGSSQLTETNLETINIQQKRHTYAISTAIGILGTILGFLFCCPSCIGQARNLVATSCTSMLTSCKRVIITIGQLLQASSLS